MTSAASAAWARMAEQGDEEDLCAICSVARALKRRLRASADASAEYEGE